MGHLNIYELCYPTTQRLKASLTTVVHFSFYSQPFFISKKFKSCEFWSGCSDLVNTTANNADMYQMTVTDVESGLNQKFQIQWRNLWDFGHFYLLCEYSLSHELPQTMIWTKGPKIGGPCLDYLHPDLVSLQCKHTLLGFRPKRVFKKIQMCWLGIKKIWRVAFNMTTNKEIIIYIKRSI